MRLFLDGGSANREAAPRVREGGGNLHIDGASSQPAPQATNYSPIGPQLDSVLPLLSTLFIYLETHYAF